MKKNSTKSPHIIGYYKQGYPIGLFVLLNSLKEQRWTNYGDDLCRTGLYLIIDFNFLFMSLDRLRQSMLSENKWKIAFDATSFLLFIRIYYDSLASLVYYLFRLRYPNNSRNWPKGHSFQDQLKWIKKNKGEEFLSKYDDYIQSYDFDKIFSDIKSLRDKLKTGSTDIKSIRLVYATTNTFPNTKELKTEIGLFLHRSIEFSDFIGDFFLMKLSENKPLVRMEETHHGYPVAKMTKKQQNTYRWFTKNVLLTEKIS